jgi:hypothetical protein
VRASSPISALGLALPPRAFARLIRRESLLSHIAFAMTILHKEQPISLKGLMSEHHNCIDCGINTHPGAPPRELAEFLMKRDGKIPMTISDECEVYIVRDAVWKKAGVEPYGGCLCIGCLESRLGRKLKPQDFRPDHPFNDMNMPGTQRLRDRRGY